MSLYNQPVDVVIPVFNGANSILAAVNSVLNQKNVLLGNVFIINDGSTDNTLDVLGFIRDSHIKVISIPNSGVSYARNLGISFCNSNWIAFLDADDYWFESKLYNQLKIANTNQVDFICGSTGNINRNNDSVINSSSLLLGNYIVTSSVLMKRQLAHRVESVFNVGLTFAEDYDAWFKLLSISKGYFSSEKLFYYHISETPHYKLKDIFFNMLSLELSCLKFLLNSNLSLFTKFRLFFVLTIGVSFSFLGIIKRFLIAFGFIKYEK